jgi:hypothetical protein
MEEDLKEMRSEIGEEKHRTETVVRQALVLHGLQCQ